MGKATAGDGGGPRARLTQSMEDYLEEIYDLTRQARVARVRDIAAALNVSMSSVTGALRKLAARGLVHYAKYQYITLTDEGRALAAEVKGGHRILARFLEEALGLETRQAEDNACCMEHALDREATGRFLEFLEFLELGPDALPTWAEEFGRFQQERASTGYAARRRDGEAALAEVPQGASAVVTRIEDAETGDRRIAMMGLLPGTPVTVQRAPAGGDGSILLRINGEPVSLSSRDLCGVRVRVSKADAGA